MPLGAHLPISKGFEAALRFAQDLDCDCLQIFCKSPRTWYGPPLDRDKADKFRAAWGASGLKPLVAHDSYLINLAAPDDTIRKKSIDAMVDEVERADALGCDYLVTHCGAHLQKDCDSNAVLEDGSFATGVELGLRRLAESLQTVFDRVPDARVKVALENTAGQGTCLGGPFEHLARVIALGPTDNLAVCFDTCHAYAAGHDISTKEGLEQTLQYFDRTVGLERLAVVHLNDSKGELGRHLDRHEHIGQGRIGREAMQRIVTHPKLCDRPFILETPDMETMVGTNLATVRELQG